MHDPLPGPGVPAPDLPNRRRMLSRSAIGFGGLALQWIMSRDRARGATPAAASRPRAPIVPHHPAKAKGCIFLYMAGGPSQVDLFDPKPLLSRLHGERLPKEFGNIEGQFVRDTDVLMASSRTFRRHGQSGMEVSDWMPHTAGIVDDIALIRSCHCDSFIHEAAEYQFTTGRITSGFPSIGSWLTYGLGSEADNLPAYVVLPDKQGLAGGGKPTWGSGFLPVVHQGTVFLSCSSPILDLQPPPGREGVTGGWWRPSADSMPRRRTRRTMSSPLASPATSWPSACKTPREAVDLSTESRETLELYGVGDELTDDFARRCLLARRLVERGVRFVLVFGGAGGGPQQLGRPRRHRSEPRSHVPDHDQPSAALIKDLKRRGLLDETLVLWGGEFGRTPVRESNATSRGRDHNPNGYSMWMAGGGVKGGVTVGETDDIGLRAVKDRCHVHAIHATILHQMGLDYEDFTVLHNGREERLTDVGGRLIREITGPSPGGSQGE
ncbi:MAG: DUF1501 domain-containing protein [Singulisphaera sp.]